MFAWLFRRWKRTPPTVDRDDVARLRCTKCGNQYESWDGTLHNSPFRYLREYGEILGRVILYCPPCKRGGAYHLTSSGLASDAWPIELDYLPPSRFLQEIVSIDHIRERLSGAFEPSFALQTRIFTEAIEENDQIWFFNSDSDSWSRLAGRRG